MNTAELIYQEAKTLPDNLGAEVLDFIGYLKTRQPVEAVGIMTNEEHRALCEELQTLVESQPAQTESADEFIRKMRDGARY
jgi:hypothetical protein